MLKFNLSIIVGCLLALLLNSCTPNSQIMSSENATSEQETKKIFALLRGGEPRSLDPVAQFDTASGAFVSAVYDTLLSYHYLKRPFELVPSLLLKMPEVSKDGLVYSFELRKGIKFNDDEAFPNGTGREVTADDVIYSLKRFADINLNTNSWFLLDGVIQGLNDLRERTKKQKFGKTELDKINVAGLKILNKYQFEISLTRKNPLFLYALAASSTSVVAHEAVTKYGRSFARHPVGTGPFVLKKYRKKQTMILVKNPNYFKKYPNEGAPGDAEAGLLKDAGKQLPLVDEVHSHYIPESQPGMLKFLSGDLDWVALDRDNFVKMATHTPDGKFLLNKEYAKKFSIYSAPSISSVYFRFNSKDKLVGKNKNLRKALAYAFDAKGKIELLQNGRGFKLSTVVPLPISGSQLAIGDFGYEWNLKQARKHLAQAGYPGGKGLPPIEMTFGNTSSSVKRVYEFMRSNFAKIGVTLVADFKTWPKYLKSTDAGDFQIAASAWQADYPDPENFYQLFYGPNKAPGSNKGAFSHSEFDQLYEQMKQMKPSPERDVITTKMARILQEEVAVILDYNPILVGLLQKWVGNFKRNTMMGNQFSYVNVGPKEQ